LNTDPVVTADGADAKTPRQSVPAENGLPSWKAWL
jgi:hypothetical protein